MAITWGPVSSQHLYVGIDVSTSPDLSAVTKDTATVAETWKIYLKADPTWWYDDNLIFTIRGLGPNPVTVNYHYVTTSSTAATPVLVTTQTRNAPTFYDSANVEMIDVQVGGIGNSTSTTGGPEYARTLTIPKRPPQLPGSPTALSVTRTSDTSTKLSWTLPSTATTPSNRWDNVEIQRQVDGGPWTALTTYAATTRGYDSSANGGSGGDKYTLTPGASTYTDTTTTANHSYTYRVRGTNASGASGFVTSSTAYTTPAAPSNLSAVKSGTNITLSWTGNAPGVTSYEISDNGTVIASGLSPSSTTTTLTNVSTSSTHSYTVRAVAGGLTSPWSNAVPVQLLAAPAAPTNLVPNGSTSVAGQAATLTWQHNATDATAQTAYEVQYRVAGASTWTSLGKTSSSASAASLPTATASTTYEWQVRTWGDYATSSPWSSTASFTTARPPAMQITSPAGGGKLNASVLNVSWTYSQPDGSPQKAYHLDLFQDGSSTPVASLDGTGDATTASFGQVLQDHGVYSVSGYVVESRGLQSPVASTGTFTVAYKEPDPPSLSVQWVEGFGYAQIDGAAATTGDPLAQNLMLQRSLDGGTWETLAVSGAATGINFQDYTAPMVGVATYRLLATSALPSTSETDATLNRQTDDVGCNLYLSGGTNFSTVLRLRLVTARKYTGGRNRVVNRWSGRRDPVETSGVSIDKKMDVTAKILPLMCDDGTNRQATRQEIEDLFDMIGPHLYRDSDGRRMFCTLSDVSIDMLRGGEVTFTATQAEGGTVTQLRELAAYHPARLVEILPGEFTIVGGELEHIAPAKWSGTGLDGSL